jgi:UDP-galactopyranose mutase
MKAEFFKENLGPAFSTSMNQDDHDLVVFSHLRWDFVFQRPQHLITRFAKNNRRVFFIEEPHFTDAPNSSYEKLDREHGIQVVVPQLPSGLNQEEMWEELRMVVDQMIEDEDIEEYTAWYYTPMALAFTRHLEPSNIVFDCMDELSAFKHAPVHLLQLEAELMAKADVVFTGGHSLYEAKKHRHHNIHAFPSSIDGDHFRLARSAKDPEGHSTSTNRIFWSHR